MISLSKQKQFLQIILGFGEPMLTERITRSATSVSDIIWINVNDFSVHEYNRDLNSFKQMQVDLFKDLIYLNYRKFIVLGRKELAVTSISTLEKLTRLPGLNQLVIRAPSQNHLLARIPRNLVIADSTDKLLLVLFQLLIKVHPSDISQLTANLLNAANIFDNLIIDKDINV